jgi:hypothetical protein
VPRLEYIEEDAPRVWPALATAGFAVERRTPVMIATPATRLGPRSPAATTIRQSATDADLAAPPLSSTTPADPGGTFV